MYILTSVSTASSKASAARGSTVCLARIAASITEWWATSASAYLRFYCLFDGGGQSSQMPVCTAVSASLVLVDTRCASEHIVSPDMAQCKSAGQVHEEPRKRRAAKTVNGGEVAHHP